MVEKAVKRAVLFAVLTAAVFGMGCFYAQAQTEEEDYEAALGVEATDDVEVTSVEESIEEPVPAGIEIEKDAEQEQYTVFNESKFTVTPVVANEKAKPRDIIKKELMVTNNTSQRIDLYISVENIDPNEGAQEFVSPGISDLSISLANWVEITRGVIELGPGETRKIPYLIHVNLTAKPGSYYARIQFKEGPKRNEATPSKEGSALMLNLEVEDDANERLQLGNFISEDSVVFGNSVGFSYLLENVGNRLVEPRGSIRIFNRRGEEVGSVPLNANGSEINPENKELLAAAWNATGRFGKYKAFLDLEYGENQLASVQDTVYFWVFPWKEIFTALAGVLLLGVVGTYIVHMRSIAHPVPVRSNRQPVPQEAYSNAPTPSELRHAVTHITPAPAVATPSQSGQGKHLTVLRANTGAQQAAVQGDTVRLGGAPGQRGQSETHIKSAPRQQEVKVNGNVVQLTSRRK